jgi:hypothetical protein
MSVSQIVQDLVEEVRKGKDFSDLNLFEIAQLSNDKQKRFWTTVALVLVLEKRNETAFQRLIKGDKLVDNERIFQSLCAVDQTFPGDIDLRIRCVQFLIDHGGDIHFKDDRILLLGVVYGTSLEMLKYLIETCHCDVRKADKDNLFVQNAAMQRGNGNRLVKLLVENGANPYIFAGDTLRTAVQHKNYSLLNYLFVDCEIDVGAFGNVALYTAAAEGDETLVKGLLKFKADPNVDRNTFFALVENPRENSSRILDILVQDGKLKFSKSPEFEALFDERIAAAQRTRQRIQQFLDQEEEIEENADERHLRSLRDHFHQLQFLGADEQPGEMTKSATKRHRINYFY